MARARAPGDRAAVGGERGRTPRLVGRRDAERLRDLHEQRLAALLAEFRSLGLDHVVVGDPDPVAIVRAFVDWAEARIAYRRGGWQ